MQPLTPLGALHVNHLVAATQHVLQNVQAAGLLEAPKMHTFFMCQAPALAVRRANRRLS